MIVAVFALVVLAGLVFYVLNTGRQVQRRAETQHAADAAAEAGATRLARGFNTIAQNQVATARSLALVNVLDAAPLAVEFTLADQNAVLEAATRQLQSANNSRWTADTLRTLRENVQAELALLGGVDAVFTMPGFDLRDVTFFEPSAGGRGWLWRAMASLDAVSRGAVDSLHDTAQQAAVERGEQHLHGPDAVALTLPLARDLPVERGGFADFERPVHRGLLPYQIDHHLYRRGPWDTVFGWREPIGGLIYVSGGGSDGASGRGDVPIGSGAGSSAGGQVIRTGPATAYRVIGPQPWMLASLHDTTERALPHARFAAHVGDLAEIKLDYFRGGGAAAAVREVIDPEWETRFDRAVLAERREDLDVHETGFIAVEIKSRHDRADPRFLQPGTWSYVAFNYLRTGGGWSTLDVNRTGARLVVVDGWTDPRDWDVPRVNNYTWRDEWQYTALYDTDLGLAPQFDDDGEPIPHTVHRVDEFVFMGVNIGEEVEVRNPHNWSPGDDDLPAPYRFAQGALEHDDPAARRDHLTVLGIARQATPAPFWADRFDDNRPFDGPLAVAQADVFNNHSWDLWTPMWHARLTRVTGYGDWIDRFTDQLGAASTIAGLSATDVRAVRDHLAATEALADDLLAH